MEELAKFSRTPKGKYNERRLDERLKSQILIMSRRLALGAIFCVCVS
jgi:hypothetical protein